MSARYTTLISAANLAVHLHDPHWVVIDCRHDLAKPAYGREAYAQSHIPGAFFFSLDHDLAGPLTGKNGRHPLPDSARFMRKLGEAGITPDTQVVAYDESGGLFAARLWWMLRWVGHDKVAVLDGGLPQWRAEGGRPESSDVPAWHPGHVYPGTLQDIFVDAAYVLAHLNDSHIKVLDARSPERFRGENETLDPVGGHIPGAINRFFMDNLAPDGTFRPAPELRNAFTTLLGDCLPTAVVNQCGSGVSACHNLLAMEIAGLHGSHLYPGSWSEWCADPERPVAR